MNLSKYFELEEFPVSEYAARNGIDNRPGPGIHIRLERLAESLDEVRELLGHPVIITSGYRTEALNRAIGGVKTSDHIKGLAAEALLWLEANAETAMAFVVGLAVGLFAGSSVMWWALP